jgi:methionine synthase II (cobalamin-independent)
MTAATGIGSMPGADAADYKEAVRVVLGELPELPHIPEMPGRGVQADMTGRALAVMAELGADLQPAGWRLTDAPGVDHRRAKSLLAQDLDAVEEQARDFSGRFKIQVAGPWTLAATVERPRGDRVLADHGARRELAQALAEGLRDHVADVRRRLPDADIVVQVDEPALPAVLAAQVPTASGFGRHRTVHPPDASAALEWVFSAIADAGATSVVHCCASDVPVLLLTGAGAQGISVDLEALAHSAYDNLGTVLESGAQLLLGIVPSTATAAQPTERAMTEQVQRFLDRLGFDLEVVGGQLTITPTCGLAGSDPAYARRALQLSHKVAANLAAGA